MCAHHRHRAVRPPTLKSLWTQSENSSHSIVVQALLVTLLDCLACSIQIQKELSITLSWALLYVVLVLKEFCRFDVIKVLTVKKLT